MRVRALQRITVGEQLLEPGKKVYELSDIDAKNLINRNFVEEVKQGAKPNESRKDTK